MPDSPDPKSTAHRRDAEGRIQTGPTWESLVDRQIRAAQEAGQFENLPHHGAPLPKDDNPLAGDWELAFHMLKNAGVAPPWVEATKELRGMLARRDAIIERASADRRLRDHAALEELVTEINMAVARLNAEAPSAAHRAPLRLADELARYDSAADIARKP
jgi:hypothetical protein